MGTSIKAKRDDFSDTGVQAGFRDPIEKYSGKQGRRDILRIVTDAMKFYGANVKYKDRGFYAISLADPDDIALALDKGDKDAMERCKKACPLFKRGYEIKPKWVVLVWWVCSFKRDGKRRSVDRVLSWIFGADKYTALRSIRETLPRVVDKDGNKTNRPKPFRRFELSCECNDENFQKMTIAAITDKTAMQSEYDEMLAAVKDEFETPNDFTSECALIDEALTPETRQKLESSLDRAEGKGRFKDEGDEFDDDLDDDRPRNKSKGNKSKGKTRNDSSDDADDDDADDDKDADDADDDSDQRDSRERRRESKSGNKDEKIQRRSRNDEDRESKKQSGKRERDDDADDNSDSKSERREKRSDKSSKGGDNRDNGKSAKKRDRDYEQDDDSDDKAADDLESVLDAVDD